jgi:hypothetical protein
MARPLVKVKHLGHVHGIGVSFGDARQIPVRLDESTLLNSARVRSMYPRLAFLRQLMHLAAGRRDTDLSQRASGGEWPSV